jgi:hypothetical protein
VTALWVQPNELGDMSNSEYAEEACRVASYLMWAMSGRKFFGTGTTTERYIRNTIGTLPGLSTKTNIAMLYKGEVRNVMLYAQEWTSPEARIRLRARPVTEIHTIRLDNGTIVSPKDYVLVDNSTVQFYNASLWNPYNVEITYSYGTPPPVAGKMAARTLAREFAKLWAGDEDCALPRRITSISRQGVSYTLLDSQDFIDEIKTGVYEVDLFLKTANPAKATQRSRVFSVDVPRGRRYNPKPVKLTASASDLTIPAGSSDSVTLPLADIDGAFLLSESGWTLVATAYNWAQNVSVDIPSSQVVLDEADEEITVTITYNDVYNALRSVDPGVWDLYAEKDGTIVSLASGNLQISLS